MPNPLRDEWLHGPNADPDPIRAEAVALITEYQLGMLSDIERAAVEQRLKTDLPFATAAAPLLFAARVVREERQAQRAAQQQAQQQAQRQARGETQSAEHGTPRAVRPPKRDWAHQHLTVWRIAAGILFAAAIFSGTKSAYGAILRSHLPPSSVTFTNAPLSVVMAELRRRYHIDVEVCDVGFNQDHVTMTLKDAPVDDVVEEIAQQTLRIGHWKSPYVLRFQPQPDLYRGWVYNLRVVVRFFTNRGCHR